MSSNVITLNQSWNYNCIIPDNSHEVKKSLKEAVLVSEKPNLLYAHFAATGYGIKTLALSFFNTFAYFFLGIYHFTKEIFHCSCKEAFKLLGSNLADSIKSLCASILGVAVVAVGFFFSRKIYSCFVERKNLSTSTSSSGTTLPKVVTSTRTASIQKTTSKQIEKKEPPVIEKKKDEKFTLKPEIALQAKRDVQSFRPIVEEGILSSKPPKNKEAPHLPLKDSMGFSRLPTVMTTHINSFLDPKSQSSFASVCKDLSNQARQRVTTFVIDDSFPWEKFSSAEDFLHRYKDYSNVRALDFNRVNKISEGKLAHLAAAIKKGCFPNLKHFFFNYIMLQNLSKNQLELIPLIESCPNLVSFYSNYQLCDCYNVRFSWEVLKALFIHCKSLKYLALPSFAHLTSGKLRMVLRNLPQLKRLVTSTKFTDEQVAIVLKHCPQLEQITFRYCDKTLTQEGLRAFAKQKNQLKKINFNRSAQILTKEILKELLKNSPFLEEIYLDARDWNDEQFKGLAHLPSTLKTLSLESSPYATDAGFEDFPYLPELRHLRIHHGYCGFRLTDATISRLAERCPNLRLLELSGLEGAQDVAETHISENALIQCISKYPDLQYLDLSNMGFLSDNLLKTISEKLPKLRFLNILGSGWFTKQGLGYLKECKNLRYLNINRMRFSDNFVPTEEYVRALIPQLKLLLLTDKDPRHFPDSALIEAGLPPMSDE